MLQEEDTGTSLLGFDLRVFHPTMGEVYHNTNMNEFMLLDMKKTLKKTVDDDRWVVLCCVSVVLIIAQVGCKLILWYDLMLIF